MRTVRRTAHHKRVFQAILSRPPFAAWRTSASASEGERTEDRRGGYPAMFLLFFFTVRSLTELRDGWRPLWAGMTRRVWLARLGRLRGP